MANRFNDDDAPEKNGPDPMMSENSRVDPAQGGKPDRETPSVDQYLFTPRNRRDRRAEAFLEEWVRRFSRA